MHLLRLIDDPPAPGCWNMAVDEALLTGLAAGQSLPTLRFYSWEPAAISIGYSQDLSDVDLVACTAHGCDVVRRPTGGRAVLHVAEITYALTSTAGSLSVKKTYELIGDAIRRALSRLKLEGLVNLDGGQLRSEAQRLVDGGQQRSEAQRFLGGKSADCFANTTPADVALGGRKIVGSAQVRRQGCFLQHGAVKLENSPWLPEPQAKSQLNPISVAQFKRHLAQELGLPWRPASLTDRECREAAAIVARKSSEQSRSGRSLRNRPTGS